MSTEVRTGISAIVTAYERIDQTLNTLRIIEACDPKPDELLVHVDANRVEVERAILDLNKIPARNDLGGKLGINQKAQLLKRRHDAAPILW